MSELQPENDDTSSLKTTPLAYQRVREHLSKIIHTNPSGSKLPAERDLSNSLRVNRGTVRRAIAELESEGYVIRQQGRGTFTKRSGRFHSASNSSTSSGDPERSVYLLVGSLEVPFHLEILSGVEDAAEALGYDVWTRQFNLNQQRDLALVKRLETQTASGFLICCHNSNATDPEYAGIINRLLEKGLKIVVLDQPINGCPARVAMVDKFQVGYLPTEQLIVSGHRRICYLSTHNFDPSGDESYRGYRQALADYGLEYRQELEINISVDFSTEPSRQLIIDNFTINPAWCSAIVTNSFSMAYGVMLALQDLGFEICTQPKQLREKSVVLIGNNHGWNPKLAHLPHIVQGYDQTGQEGMRLLHQEIIGVKQPRHCLIAPQLVWPEAGFPAPQNNQSNLSRLTMSLA